MIFATFSHYLFTLMSLTSSSCRSSQTCPATFNSCIGYPRPESAFALLVMLVGLLDRPLPALPFMALSFVLAHTNPYTDPS